MRALHFFLRLNSTISEKNNVDKNFLFLGTGVIRNIRDCVKEIYPEKNGHNGNILAMTDDSRMCFESRNKIIQILITV